MATVWLKGKEPKKKQQEFPPELPKIPKVVEEGPLKTKKRIWGIANSTVPADWKPPAEKGSWGKRQTEWKKPRTREEQEFIEFWRARPDVRVGPKKPHRLGRELV